jgi:hypothetical protein
MPNELGDYKWKAKAFLFISGGDKLRPYAGFLF